VITSQWVVHRDPRWWDEPESFTPDRWLNTEARNPGTVTSNQGRPKYSYFPFGGGSRVCIGESFAWTEAILLLATIAQRWKFVAKSTPTLEPRITLRPNGLHMQPVAR
jgi:cytochrome P450